VGDETTEFATRFSSAVSFLDGFARGSAPAAPAGAGRAADPRAALRGALEAVEAVYATDTGAVRQWPEQRRRVLAQLARLRGKLGATRIGDDVRREARALVLLIDPGARGGADGGSARG
jgi:hypothetical protein